MPLSEFLRMARENFESSQPRTDVVSRVENDFVELIWENGQIGMQGQSGRPTKSPIRNSNTSRVGKFGGFESVLNDMAPVVPSGELDLSQDDEVSWLSYPIDDPLGQDFVSDLLPNISGVTGNGMSNRSSFLSSVDKRNSCNNQGSNVLRSGVSDIVSNNTCNNRDASMKMERQNIRPPSNFLNFSHFSRPANLVKGKPDGMLASGSLGVGRVEINPAKSRLERFDSTPKDHGGSPPKRTENLVQETSIKNDNPRKAVPNEEKTVEPMAASSSVGSGNSGDRVSCEQRHNSKRKFRDIDESDWRSDDVDTESLDARKTNHVRGSKRGRAAEVHNLSERRRRDRINEKMRALQELIPNCNKADKASMLDEAIEYLKTLQLQVQMMSMGAGFCMPPMMFQQHMHPAQFPPMGVGMGFGMGMMDMNGVSSGYPSMFPVNPMHFPPPVSGIPNYQRIPVFQNSVPRAPFGPFTGTPPIRPGVGMNSSRNGCSSEVANTSPIENAEAGCSMSDKSNQATTEVLDQSQGNKQGTNVMGTTALTSATATTDNSKEPAGEHNKSPL